jgi:hypothetical protein
MKIVVIPAAVFNTLPTLLVARQENEFVILGKISSW